MQEKNALKTLKRRSVLAVPSLFTVGNMACGFLSILAAMHGNFYRAGWFIFFAMLLDGVDGRIARMLNAETEFGVEMDSLADIISFCAAPAFLMYFMVLSKYAFVGMAIAFVFLLCGALRLARFNAMAHAGTGSKKHFSGLPVPAAAGILAAFAVSYSIFMESGGGQNMPYVNAVLPHIYNLMAFIVVGLGVLMVSNIPYAAFKGKSEERKKMRVSFIILAAFLVYLLIRYPQNVVFIVFSLYVLAGIVAVFYRAFKNMKL